MRTSTCCLNIDISLLRLSLVFFESSRTISGYARAAEFDASDKGREGLEVMETGEEVRELTIGQEREGGVFCEHSYIEGEECEVEELSFPKLLF